MKQPKASMIHGFEKMEQNTFLHKKISFQIGIYVQQPNSFELLIVLWYRIARIILTIVNYPNSLSVILFFLQRKFRFQQEHNLIHICTLCSQHFLKMIQKTLLFLQHDRSTFFHHRLTVGLDISYLYNCCMNVLKIL